MNSTRSTKISDNELYLNVECEFEVQRLEYLGVIITPDSIEMDPVKLEGIKDWLHQKRSETSDNSWICNFYRKFINNYSKIAVPHILNPGNKAFEWTSEAETAFKQLKKEFMKLPVLQMVDESKTLRNGMRCISNLQVEQWYYKEIQTEITPRGYFSKAHAPAVSNTPYQNLEFLAIIKALKEWRHYLEFSKYINNLVRS